MACLPKCQCCFTLPALSTTTASPMTKTNPPKRRNATQTKARILAAAQKAFAQQGYAQAGIRDIATMADVSSPMLLRYFGSKAGLFEAALIDAIDQGDLYTTSKEGFGKRLAALFSNRDLDITPPAIIALSTGHPDAQAITTRVTQEYALEPLAKWLGAPDGYVRALEIFMLSTSFVLYSRQLPLSPASIRGKQQLQQWLATSIQQIVDKQ